MGVEVEPIINDLLVQLISLAVVNKSQKENIGEKSFCFNYQKYVAHSFPQGNENENNLK